MAIPTLTVISGPPGAGKTTLAHGLAERIGWPVVCRDEIKQGMVHAAGPAATAAGHDQLNRRTLAVFFAVLETLVRAEVSVVAEAAYQDRLWRPGLVPLLPLAHVLLVRCRVQTELARSRQHTRLRTDLRRVAHQDAAHLGTAELDFAWPELDVPTLDLDTGAELTRATATAAAFTLSGGGAR